VKTVFGDLDLDWRGQRLRRGGAWALVGEETADLVEALMLADGHALSGEALWRAVQSKTLPFDGRAMSRIIADANSALAPHDAEIETKDFMVRLIDITPRPFLRPFLRRV
jgi:DNA-binding response OmpR family regulator